MTGWILFTEVTSLIIGIILGWGGCTLALTDYFAKKKEEEKKEEENDKVNKEVYN